MMLRTRVECSAKIAMRALRAWRVATGLLPDIDQAPCIFLMRLAMYIFRIPRISPARRRDRDRDRTMNGKRVKFFICDPRRTQQACAHSTPTTNCGSID